MSTTITRRLIDQALKNFAHDSVKTDRVIEDFFACLDTPKSLAAYMLYRYDEHVQLLDLEADPSNYIDRELFGFPSADLFHRDYIAINFLSKADFLNLPYDKKARALEKFQKMEDHCDQTNQRLSLSQNVETSGFASLLFTMRRKIDLILGEFDIEEFFDQTAWGPGVSTLLKGEDTSASRKFQSETGITSDLYRSMSHVLPEAYPGWWGREHDVNHDSSFTIQDANTVTTVPKNSKTERVIAIEPGINLFFQKSIGSIIRNRLRSWGINLRDQRVNQEFARIGSFRAPLATIDFSSASDTIASKLVELVLPPRWFTVLDLLRSKGGILNGTSFRWNKFSSMGNGFTFELESLIFFAAALACCEARNSSSKDVSVYGDDVIIPLNATDLFIEFSEFIGFIPNRTKSFTTGVFRESCGSHWFNGVDVKPIFLKERLSDALSVYKLANSVRRLSHRRNFNYGCDVRFLASWRSILQGLPAALRSLRVPEGFGDGGILSNFDESCPTKARDGYEGYLTSAARETGIKVSHESHGLLIARLNQIKGPFGSPLDEMDSIIVPNYNTKVSTQSFGNTETLRGRTRKQYYRLHVYSWYNLGSWW